MKGAILQEAFLNLEKGIKPSFCVDTSDGVRYVDNWLNGTARELKSGRIKLNNSFKRQVRKYLEIIKNEIKKVGVKPDKFKLFYTKK